MPTHVVGAYVLIVESNRVLELFAIYYDISGEHKRFQGLIYRFTGILFGMAVLPLEGLYNRRGFFVPADQQLKAAKHLKTKILLVSADVNGLKWINVNLGHHEGDRALVEAADILRESYRESDINARVGGDEFVVLTAEQNDINRDILTSRFKENLDRRNSKHSRGYELFQLVLGQSSMIPKILHPLTG